MMIIFTLGLVLLHCILARENSEQVVNSELQRLLRVNAALTAVQALTSEDEVGARTMSGPVCCKCCDGSFTLSMSGSCSSCQGKVDMIFYHPDRTHLLDLTCDMSTEEKRLACAKKCTTVDFDEVTQLRPPQGTRCTTKLQSLISQEKNIVEVNAALQKSLQALKSEAKARVPTVKNPVCCKCCDGTFTLSMSGSCSWCKGKVDMIFRHPDRTYLHKFTCDMSTGEKRLACAKKCTTVDLDEVTQIRSPEVTGCTAELQLLNREQKHMVEAKAALKKSPQPLNSEVEASVGYNCSPEDAKALVDALEQQADKMYETSANYKTMKEQFIAGIDAGKAIVASPTATKDKRLSLCKGLKGKASGYYGIKGCKAYIELVYDNCHIADEVSVGQIETTVCCKCCDGTFKLSMDGSCSSCGGKIDVIFKHPDRAFYSEFTCDISTRESRLACEKKCTTVDLWEVTNIPSPEGTECTSLLSSEQQQLVAVNTALKALRAVHSEESVGEEEGCWEACGNSGLKPCDFCVKRGKTACCRKWWKECAFIWGCDDKHCCVDPQKDVTETVSAVKGVASLFG